MTTFNDAYIQYKGLWLSSQTNSIEMPLTAKTEDASVFGNGGWSNSDGAGLAVGATVSGFLKQVELEAEVWNLSTNGPLVASRRPPTLGDPVFHFHSAVEKFERVDAAMKTRTQVTIQFRSEGHPVRGRWIRGGAVDASGASGSGGSVPSR